MSISKTVLQFDAYLPSSQHADNCLSEITSLDH